MTSPDQRNLFDNNLLPEGFRYEPEFLLFTEQVQLVRHLEKLPLRDFEFHGFLGKRRVVSFGWRYDFNDRELLKADDMPAFLLPLRRRAAAFAGLGPEDLQHVLVTEYAPGAAIGWHRDKAVFGEVVGISLLSPCRFRFRRRHAGTWQRAAFIAEPRSAYLLAGPARSDWEHSIPPMEQLRYSITFRNFVKASVTARLRA
jgi:alkylated DNA repair dioxygenase AlkB